MTCRVVFSGPFCCGKTTLRDLLEKDGIPKIIDDTTRPMREKEKQGFPYNFISEEEFLRNEGNNYYFEAVSFNGYHYGVPRHLLTIQTNWSLDILSKSWTHYKHIPDVVGIYLEPPSHEELIRRARLRGDSEQKIKERLEALKDEDPTGFTHRIPSQKTIEEVYILVKRILFPER